jgi:hypothetical protein
MLMTTFIPRAGVSLAGSVPFRNAAIDARTANGSVSKASQSVHCGEGAHRADERQSRIGPTDGAFAPERSPGSRRDTGEIDDMKRRPQRAEVILDGRFHVGTEYNRKEFTGALEHERKDREATMTSRYP